MLLYNGNQVYLTRIYRTDKKRNSVLERGCKYIAFVYDCGDCVAFYPMDSKKAIEAMKSTFKIERGLALKKKEILDEIFNSDPMGILN